MGPQDMLDRFWRSMAYHGMRRKLVINQMFIMIILASWERDNGHC
jgi:hypothetical protein